MHVTRPPEAEIYGRFAGRDGDGHYHVEQEHTMPTRRPNRMLIRRPSSGSTRRMANQGLKDIYYRLGGESWKLKMGWMDPGSDVREWHGLQINTNGELESINLINNNLDGELPDSVCNILSLRELNLSYNFGIRGWIPRDIGRLINLKTLHLYSAGISGEIPESLSYLEKLEELFLNCNHLVGRIPPWLGRLHSLRKLFLNSNNLTGPVPAELSLLTSLDSLNLSWNELSGVVPYVIHMMSNLKLLALEGNEGLLEENYGGNFAEEHHLPALRHVFPGQGEYDFAERHASHVPRGSMPDIRRGAGPTWHMGHIGSSGGGSAG
ncbi:unnamed protein product, partial [Discosporangium mesarthrocarpum]